MSIGCVEDGSSGCKIACELHIFCIVTFESEEKCSWSL